MMRRAVELACAGLSLLALFTWAGAQTDTHARRSQSPDQSNAQARTNADEDFDLDISERHITEHDFFDSTSVAVGDGQSTLVRVGVALGALEIDVLLRNVRGHVRFHASLDPILRVLDARRVTPAPSNTPAP